jgi:hypothetical protein
VFLGSGLASGGGWFPGGRRAAAVPRRQCSFAGGGLASGGGRWVARDTGFLASDAWVPSHGVRLLIL